jgi:hypothetical protein
MASGTKAPVGAGGISEGGQVRTITFAAALAGLLAIVCSMLYGLVNQSFAPGWYAPVWVSGLGLLAIVVFVVFNFDWLSQVVTGRAAMSGMLVALMCAAAVTIWIGGNFFFNYRGRWGGVRLAWSGDLTRLKRFTLSDMSTKQLDELQSALEIFVIGRAGSAEEKQVDDLLESYARYSDKVKLEFLTPGPDYERKRKSIADRMRISPNEISFRSITLLYGDKFKRLEHGELWKPEYGANPYAPTRYVCHAEGAITSGIFEMLDPQKTRVYFVVDHGEKNPQENTQNGLSVAAELLRRNNIESEVLDLRTVKDVPEDATVVALCGPTRSITPGEVEVLGRYLQDRRGRLLICLDEFNPAVDIGLDMLLESVGIRANRDLVIEPNREYTVGRGLPFVLGKDWGSEPRAIVDALGRAGVRPTFLGARSLSRVEEYQGPFKAFELCSGSSASYGETDLRSYFDSGRTENDQGRDTEGPIHYAMFAWEGPTPMSPMAQMTQKLGRVAVFGDSDWCGNMIIMNPMVSGCQDNRTLLMATVSWLTEKEHRITIAPKRDTESQYSMPSKHKVIGLVVLWSLPVSLLVLSAVVFWARRR